MELLQYPLNGAEILRRRRALKKELAQKPGLADKKIAILSGSTVGEVKNVLELFLLDGGIRPSFHVGEYGLFYEDIVFDSGALAAFAPDLIYIHTSARNLRSWPAPDTAPEQAGALLQEEYGRFQAVWQAAGAFGCPVIQNNFEEPAFRNFGNLDASDPRGRVHFVRQLNQRMAQYALQNPFLKIHDLAYLAAQNGLDRFCDPGAWYAYKYLCAPEYIPALCHSLTGLIKAVFGRNKKVLVTDLDDTLWGGTIGEVGPEGIELGEENPTGMAHAELQAYIKMLGQRGILLAAASKNEPETALAGLARPESLLKREDFLAFEVGWHPKSESIRRISENLNVLPDSFVFLDDRPAERAQVTGELPDVTAPAFNAPEEGVRLLDHGGYFEVALLSEDDVRRAQMYRDNAARQREEHSHANYDDFLKSLHMTAEIAPFRADQLERITQLINKTNQFNLTTRRYTAEEVAACAADAEGHITLAARLKDKFGDNGLTAALIASVRNGTACIDLWVMSCRVFKRQLEHALFDALVAQAQRRGIKTIEGLYLPTAKNLLVRNFYATIGFELTAENQAERRFLFRVPASYTPQNTVISVG